MWQRERLLPVFGLWLLFAAPAGAEPGLAPEAAVAAPERDRRSPMARPTFAGSLGRWPGAAH